MYAGNVGFSQSLDLVLLAARSFAVSRPEVVFVINGGGAARPGLEADGRRPPQRALRRHAARRIACPRCSPPPTSTSCRCGPGLAWSSVPSKLYSILAAGRPSGGQRGRGHRGGPHRRAGRAPASPCPRTTRRRSPTAVGRLLDDPRRGRHDGRRRAAASSRGGHRPRRWRRPTRSCSPSWRPGRAMRAHPALSMSRGAVVPARPEPRHWAAASLSAPMGKASSAKKVARAARAGGRGTAGPKRQWGYPVAIAAIVVVGVLAGALRSWRPTSGVGREPGGGRPLARRLRRSTSATRFLPPLTDVRSDTTGLHTHGDGLIHIHPFNSGSVGQEGHAGQVGRDDRHHLLVGRVHGGRHRRTTNGYDCSGQPATVSLYVWSADDLSAGPQVSPPPTSARSSSTRTAWPHPRRRARGHRRAPARAHGRRPRQASTRSPTTWPTTGASTSATTATDGRRHRRRVDDHHGRGAVRAVVLVGGFGTRLRPLTSTTPKQMLPIVDRPMIERVVGTLGAHGVTEAVLSLGYRPDAFLDAYPRRPLRRGRAPLRGRARAARHGGGGPLRRPPGRHRRHLHRGQRGRPHRPRRDRAVGLPPRPRGRGHDRPHPGGRPVPLRRGSHRRRRPGRGLRREAGAGRRPRPTGSTPAPTCSNRRSLDRIPDGRKVSIERETFPAMVEDGSLYALHSDAYWVDAGTPATYLECPARPHRRSAGARPRRASTRRPPSPLSRGRPLGGDGRRRGVRRGRSA